MVVEIIMGKTMQYIKYRNGLFLDNVKNKNHLPNLILRIILWKSKRICWRIISPKLEKTKISVFVPEACRTIDLSKEDIMKILMGAKQ